MIAGTKTKTNATHVHCWNR